GLSASRSAASFSTKSARPPFSNASIASVRRFTSRAATSRTSSSESSWRTSFSRLVIAAASMRRAPRRTLSPARKASVISSRTRCLRAGSPTVDLPPVLIPILILGALCVAYGVFVERRWYRLRRYRLDILPAGGPEQLTLLHLSDLH